ncbi:hypothetical protein SVIOM74S_09793 [Streptomyces violarus]
MDHDRTVVRLRAGRRLAAAAARLRRLRRRRQDGVEGSTLELYRTALKLRRKLLDGEELTWAADVPDGVLQFDRCEGWRCVTNLSGTAVPLPAGEVLLSSAPLEDGRLGPDTTVWLGR